MNELATTDNLPRPFEIPTTTRDQIDFCKESKSERLRIRDLLDAFRTIDGAKRKGDAFLAVAAVNRGRKGFSVETLRRLFREYKKSGYQWRVLRRDYKGPKPAKPADFKNFFAFLVSKCQGRTDVVRAARDDLFYNYWRAGKSVPGYGTFAEFWRRTQGEKPFPKVITDRPPHTPAWSYRTLLRLVKETLPKEVRLLAAHGDLRSHDCQIQLYRDRAGLKPLQYVTFDDVELDIQVLCKIGNTMEVRPLQAVMALDIATAKFVAWRIRPMLKEEDMKYFPSDAGRVLTRKQVNFVLMQILLKYGLPQNYPMKLLLENASGTLNAADRRMIETLLPARILFENTRMFDESYLGVECRAHGLPYQKGFIESSFQGLHTRIAGLDGALAPRYEFRNPASAAIAKQTEKVLDEARAKGISESLLKFKLLTFDEFLPIFDLIVERWNARTNHKLQGFDYEYETLVGSDFYNRDTAVQLLTTDELEAAKFVRRMESPEERWQKHCAGVAFSKIEVPMIYPLLQNDKRVVSVRNGEIKTEWANISADKFIYRSPELLQFEGREFTAVTPDREALWLFDRNEGFVCAVPRVGRTAIIDQTAIVRQSGYVAREREKMRELHDNFLSERKNAFAEIDVHNRAVLDDAANIGTAMHESVETHRRQTAAQKTAAKKAGTTRRAAIAAAARALEDSDEF